MKTINSIYLTKLILLTALVFCFASIPYQQASSQHNINDLSWLMGTWTGKLGPKDYMERWEQKPDGRIHGIGYYTTNSDTTLAETLIIQYLGTTLVYLVAPEGQSATMFEFKKLDATMFMVENLEHDFPQRIIYTIKEPGLLHARIEANKNGEEKAYDFYFKKLKD
jgi:uncharacterized protein DUF6265